MESEDKMIYYILLLLYLAVTTLLLHAGLTNRDEFISHKGGKPVSRYLLISCAVLWPLWLVVIAVTTTINNIYYEFKYLTGR